MVDYRPSDLDAELRRRAAAPLPAEMHGSFGAGPVINGRDEASAAVAGLRRHREVFRTQAQAGEWLAAHGGDGRVLVLFDLPPRAAGASGGQMITEKFDRRGLQTILFPVGEYETLLERTIFPLHEKRGPHDLHEALHRHGGAVLGFVVYLAAREESGRGRPRGA
jgi:hypothetical protein